MLDKMREEIQKLRNEMTWLYLGFFFLCLVLIGIVVLLIILMSQMGING